MQLMHSSARHSIVNQELVRWLVLWHKHMPDEHNCSKWFNYGSNAAANPNSMHMQHLVTIGPLRLNKPSAPASSLQDYQSHSTWQQTQHHITSLLTAAVQTAHTTNIWAMILHCRRGVPQCSDEKCSITCHFIAAEPCWLDCNSLDPK